MDFILNAGNSEWQLNEPFIHFIYFSWSCGLNSELRGEEPKNNSQSKKLRNINTRGPPRIRPFQDRLKW